MKILKLLFLVVIISLSTSCTDFVRSLDNGRCMETVQKAYPSAIVFPTDEKYHFIVADTCGAVYYVQVMGSYDKITSTVIVKHSKI